MGNLRELADVADLFAAFGMYPVVDTDQLSHNPFRVFTSTLATSDECFPTTDQEMAGRHRPIQSR